MQVTVTTEDARTIREEGSVITVTGTDDETGARVTFAGDHRPMQHLFDGVLADGEATAEVESWQVLKTVPLRTPGWLHERVNDPYGTPNKHPFWATVSFELVTTWKVFERDGVWYAYDTRYNAWAHFPDKSQAVSHASGGSRDVWA